MALLGAAIDRALARNERFAWPDSLAGDSIPFLLRLDYPEVDEAGKPQPMRGKHAALLVAIRVPRMAPVTVSKAGRIAYPEVARTNWVTATIVMQYVVDAGGKPVERTIRDLWPDDKPRPRGDLARFYDAFREAVRRGILATEYSPARVGDCAVPQLVQQPFTFDIAR